MKNRDNLTQERLRQALIYDPETGEFMHREVAGSVAKNGYRFIYIDGSAYRAHRLAWLYTYGKWPNEELDHINHKRDDNRLSNLRDVSHTVNIRNRRGPTKKNKAGFLGVRRARVGPYFVAQLVIKGKPVHLGTFPTAERAHQAYLEARKNRDESGL